MKFRQKPGSKPIPVLLDAALLDRIEKLSLRIGEPKSTVMRIAMRIGLDSLEKALNAEPRKISNVIYPSRPDEGVLVEERPSSSSSGTRRKARELLAKGLSKKSSAALAHEDPPTPKQ